MSDILKKSALVLACGLAFSANAATVTISGGDVTARINDQGTFASSGEVGGPASGTPGLSYKGVEFVNIDTPLSWWWLSASGVDYISQFGGVSAPLVPATTTAPSGAAGSVTENTTFTGLALQETYRVTGPNKVSVSVQITNNTGAALSNVKWGAGFDADQGGSGLNTTLNRIEGLGNASAVSALYTGTGPGNLFMITMLNTTTAGAVAIAPYIGDAIASVDPDVAYAAAQGVGFSTLADDTISLAYLIGTLAAGQTVTLGYDYIMTQVPEPETYAMLLAGLGLMGLIARRRRRT